MADQLQKEIRESIEKNLPTQVGNAVRERLALLEVKINEAASLDKQVDALQEEILSVREALRKANDKIAAHVELQEREEAVSDRERNAEIAELRVKLEAEQAGKAFAERMALGIVRNTEVRKSMFGTVPFKERDSSGNTWVSQTQADLDEHTQTQ